MKNFKYFLLTGPIKSIEAFQCVLQNKNPLIRKAVANILKWPFFYL